MSTSLTAIVAKVGSDVAGLRSGLKIAKSDIGRTARVMQQAKTDSDKFREAASSLHKSLRAGHIDQQQYAKGMQSISRKYMVIPKEAAKAAESTKRLAAEQQKAAAATNRMSERLKVMNRQAQEAARGNEGLIGSVRNIAAAYLSFQGAKSALKIASDMEQASISFEVMAGSAEAGKQVLMDLRQFAASTPITFDGAQKSAKTLMAFGVETNKVIPTLRMLGDVSGGNQQRFEGLSLAFAQMSAAGRLMGQDLLQMINAGFNPLQEISKNTGQSMAELKKQMEAGGISAQMVNDAFQSATSEGGRFFGMMDKMSKTALGAYNQLISAIQEMVAQMGSFLLPAMASVAKMAESLVRSFGALVIPVNKTQAQFGALVVGFTSALVVLPKLIAIIRTVIVAIKAMTTAQVTMLAFTGPKGWAMIAASAAVAVVAVVGVSKAFEKQTAEIDKATESTKKLATATKGVDWEAFAQRGAARSRAKVEEFSQSLEDMRNELAALRMGKKGEIWLAKTKAGEQGATVAQREELELLMKQRKQIEARQRQEEKRLETIKAQQEVMKGLFDQGKSLTEKHNPVAAVASQIADINRLMVVGAINEATYLRERNRILAENVRDIGQSKSPNAIEAGSQESISFITDRMNARQDEQLKKMEEQRLLQAAQKEAQIETNRLLAEIGIFKRAR